MKTARKLVSIVLVALIGSTVYGLIRTARQTTIHPEEGTAAETTPGQAAVVVDQTPLLTAQKLAHMPTSAAELPFAQQSLQIGDREMDLAFAVAVLDATERPPILTAEATEIQARLQKAQDALAAQKAQVAQLTAADGKASGAKKGALDDQLDLAKARLELRQDEADDAEQELIRAGGDPQGRIQAMVQEHEAASKASDTTKVAVSAPIEPHGLIQHFQQWSALHQKQLQLWRAKQDATSAAAALSIKHNTLQQQIGAQQKNSPVVSGGAASTPITDSARSNPSREESVAILKTTKRHAADQKMLATLTNRIDNEKQLADVYNGWINVVAAEQSSLVNGGLRGVLIILTIAIIGLFVDGGIESLIGKMSMDRRQVETLRTVTRVALQIVGVLLVLLVIFGPPTQLGTFLGLAGAGLTIALKDFIIGFFGWFVLMGRNGIRLGDWVEINGVTGEVVELGMFHTVLPRDWELGGFGPPDWPARDLYK